MDNLSNEVSLTCPTCLTERKRAVKPAIRAHGAYSHSRASGFQCLPPASPRIAGSRSLPASSDAASIFLNAVDVQ